MRFGNWRGVTLALALVAALSAFPMKTASANPFHHDIPRLTPAVDVRTGGPYYAPPVPYGHYAGKDYMGTLQKALGGLTGMLHGGCGGGGCGHLGGHCGEGHGDDCGACSGSGCGFCKGRGLFHRGDGDACGDKGCGLFKGLGHHSRGEGLCGEGGHGGSPGFASTGVHGSSQQVISSSPQAPIASEQCGEAGCGLKVRHRHKHRSGGNACGQCGGNGCGACGGHGLFQGEGDLCGGCGGAGCGLCGFLGHIKDKLCGGCGGAGCGLCGKAKSLLHAPHSLLAGLLHKNKIKYFVGPGGPVPITPGYVPYVVTTRSPRDFLAFPPFAP